jgi:hypothetical protein
VTLDQGDNIGPQPFGGLQLFRGGGGQRTAVAWAGHAGGVVGEEDQRNTENNKQYGEPYECGLGNELETGLGDW